MRGQLAKAETSGITVEQKPLAGDQPNLQDRSSTQHLGLRDAVDKRVALEHRSPNIGEIVAAANQFRALLGEIMGALFGHANTTMQRPGVRF